MVWQWAARGKHPAAKDYFQLGNQMPVVEAFCGWFESGFQGLAAARRPAEELCSWRFWARGPKKDTLVCGLGRDSADSVGRPYPLVLMGTGELSDWRSRWELLPLACEGTWSRMEYLAARRFSSLGDLEAEIAHIKPPSGGWLALEGVLNEAEKRSCRSGTNAAGPGLQTASAGPENTGREDSVWVHRLDEIAQGDVSAATSLLHKRFKQQLAEVPTAVFIGGTPRWTATAVFRRALAPGDFPMLWCGAAT